MPDFFSAETRLYVAEYELVQEMERIWHDDADRLYATLRQRLDASEDAIEEKVTSGYRYWWRKSWTIDTGANIQLWCPQYDPAILRERRLEWHVYANMSPKRRQEANAKLRERAPQLAMTSSPRLEIRPGSQPSAYKAVHLIARWESDPVEDLVAPIEEAMRRLGDAWTAIYPKLTAE